VPELPVATSLTIQSPPVFLQQSDDLAHLSGDPAWVGDADGCPT